MSNPAAAPQSSEWRRMSDKLNVFRSSAKSADYLTEGIDAKITAELTTREIVSVLDFCQKNDSELYMVTWKCNSTGQLGTMWVSETAVQELGCEALIKFWIKSSPFRDLLGLAQISSKQDIFAKKLLNWALSPPSSSSSSSKFSTNNGPEASSSPTKKKRRLRRSGDTVDSIQEIHETLCKSLNGSQVNEVVELDNVDYSSAASANGDFTSLMSFPKELQTLISPEDIGDLVGTPQNELGKVIACKKIDNNPNDPELNSYMVAWFYVAYETAETLRMQEEILQQYFTPQANKEYIERFQLQRRKYGAASLKEIRFGLKTELDKLNGKHIDLLLSPSKCSSDSECSDDASTHPPSSIHDMPAANFEDDNLSTFARPRTHAECQTMIDLNPNVCLYCQSRLGEGERIASLRHRTTIKQEVIEDEKKSEKSSTKGAVKKDASEDDEDMVDIDYEVEHIRDYKKQEGTNVDLYQIRWKGFAALYDTWEPIENLNSCDKALAIFYVNRVADRRLVEAKLLKDDGTSHRKKTLALPPLPPIPELVMEKLTRFAPVTDQEVEMAFKISKTIRKNGKWKKMQLRQALLEMVGEAEVKKGTSQQQNSELAKFDLKEARHQLLMLESERRKELILKDLKEWEKQLNRIAKGRPEIVVENNYDLCGPPKDFHYTNDNVIGEGVTFRDDPLEGCDCEDLCVKDKSLCCPGKHGKVLAYNSFKRLRVHPGYPIYECNKRCKCGPDCANRVVQDGTASLAGNKLCIFRTPNERGWGVKTLKKIKRGTFVCLYAGEIITTEEAENRGRIYENLLGASYLFDLDYYNYDETESCPYTIDATKMGNVAHFINHSCDPNLSVFNVWADCVDQNLPKLAFFALRDIDREEELTYDYGTHDDEDSLSKSPGPKFNSVILSTPTKVSTSSTSKSPSNAEDIRREDEDESEILDPALLSLSSPAKNRMKPATVSAVRRPCLCGSKNCRKVLF